MQADQAPHSVGREGARCRVAEAQRKALPQRGAERVDAECQRAQRRNKSADEEAGIVAGGLPGRGWRRRRRPLFLLLLGRPLVLQLASSIVRRLVGVSLHCLDPRCFSVPTALQDALGHPY